MSIQPSEINPRWDSYFMKRGAQFQIFWKKYLEFQQRDVLYVLGRGFDPRMCRGLEVILDSAGTGKRDCLLLEFDEGGNSPSSAQSDQAETNMKKLEDLLQGKVLFNVPVKMWSNDGQGRRRTSSLNAASVFPEGVSFDSYTDVIIDVSAMTRGVYFSLIGKAIYLVDKARDFDSERKLNLHVVVCESANLDGKIRAVGIDDAASYVHGFSGGMGEEASEDTPRVWIPILGEGHANQLERIHELVNPEETCPVLPLPTSNPRRIDNLLIEYREQLLRWRVEPSNIIYASEFNPFEAYRQISSAVDRYHRALQPLGGCKTAVSAVSSKTLSVGALLAAYALKAADLNVGLAHIEPQGYEMEVGYVVDTDAGELCTLWIAGDCYD